MPDHQVLSEMRAFLARGRIRITLEMIGDGCWVVEIAHQPKDERYRPCHWIGASTNTSDAWEKAKALMANDVGKGIVPP